MPHRTVVIGDTHIHNFRFGGEMSSQGVSYRAQLVLDAMDRAVQRHKPDVVVQLGDLHHVASPSPALVGATEALLWKWTQAGSRVVLMAGNHDVASSSAYSLQAYQWMPLVTVVGPDAFQLIPHVGVCVGWTVNPDVMFAAMELANETDSWLLAHASVSAQSGLVDGSTQSYHVARSRLEAASQNVPRILSGHVHNYSREARMCQLGAFQSTAVGEDDVGHYGVLEYDRLSDHREDVPVLIRLTSLDDLFPLRAARGVPFVKLLRSEQSELQVSSFVEEEIRVRGGRLEHSQETSAVPLNVNSAQHSSTTAQSPLDAFRAATRALVPADHPHLNDVMIAAEQLAQEAIAGAE